MGLPAALPRAGSSPNTTNMADEESLTPLDTLVSSPFARLATLLEGIDPGAEPINLSLGEPQASLPPFLGPAFQEYLREFGRYPPIKGIPELRQAIAEWMGRHYPVLHRAIDPECHVLPLNGSREGLFSAAFPALARRPDITAPVVLISEDLLSRTVAFYLCSPSNPEGGWHRARIWPRSSRLPVATAFSCSPTSATRRSMRTSRRWARSRWHKARRGASAMSSPFSRSPSDHACRACGLGSSPGTPRSSPLSPASATWLVRKRRLPSSTCRRPPGRGVACRKESRLLSRQFRRDRCGSQRPLRLSAPRRELLFMAEYGGFRGGEQAAKTLWKGCGVKVLPGAYLTKA
jgi:N-succinyldiaminopimelate aminotransferase